MDAGIPRRARINAMRPERAVIFLRLTIIRPEVPHNHGNAPIKWIIISTWRHGSGSSGDSAIGVQVARRPHVWRSGRAVRSQLLAGEANMDLTARAQDGGAPKPNDRKRTFLVSRFLVAASLVAASLLFLLTALLVIHCSYGSPSVADQLMRIPCSRGALRQFARSWQRNR
jgi:hypothetical protein